MVHLSEVKLYEYDIRLLSNAAVTECREADFI